MLGGVLCISIPSNVVLLVLFAEYLPSANVNVPDEAVLSPVVLLEHDE